MGTRSHGVTAGVRLQGGPKSLSHYQIRSIN